MEEINIYRRRGITMLMVMLFGVVTLVMLIGLILSYFPEYSQLEDLRITGTKRVISLIFMLFTAGITWRYIVGYRRRGSRPVITISPESVRFLLLIDSPEVLYFHDIESFKPIEGNFETAVVNYRVKVPENSSRFPAAIEVPLGLTMSRTAILKILNERAAKGADLPAPPVAFTPDEKARNKDSEPEIPIEEARSLPPCDKTVKIYWERWAPVVILIGILLVIGLLLWVKLDYDSANDYLWFITVSTWCDILMCIFGLAGLVVLAYLCTALIRPRLVIYPDYLVFRNEIAYFRDLKNVSVETTRKCVAQNRYVTEHFIRFNYLPGTPSNHQLHGLEPDMLEMRPRRIAAIINSRIRNICYSNKK